MKKRLINFLLRHLFNAVTEDDVVRVKSGKVYIGGKHVAHPSIASLRSQAITIKELRAWKVLIKDMKLVANKRIYETSSNVDDIVFGKAMLYAIDVLELKLDKLSKLK